MKLFGIDCSTKKIAMFMISDTENRTFELTPNPGDEDTTSRINGMYLQLVNFFQRMEPDFVFVENSPLKEVGYNFPNSVIDTVKEEMRKENENSRR